MAQYFAEIDCVEVAIADCGIGVRASFENNNAPAFNSEMSDADALELALTSQVSSKTHILSAWGEPVNAGVGLTILREISRQTGGEFDVFSYGGHISVANSEVLADKMNYRGTACHIKILRSNFKDFTQELFKAKTTAGLLSFPELGNFK